MGIAAERFTRDGKADRERRRITGFGHEREIESFDITQDGKRVLISEAMPHGQVMLAENVPEVEPPQLE